MRQVPDRVLVVTMRRQVGTNLAQVVHQVIGAGARWIWFRDRDLGPAERAALGRELLNEARRWGATLTVGGDPALAEAIGADGVHLQAAGQVGPARSRLGPESLIGVSAHALGDVMEAAEAGADYVTLSPIFPSPSKPGYGPPLGLEALTRAAGPGIPVLALGGVSPANAPSCMAAGAAGIAVMGPLMGAERPAEVYRQLAEAVGAQAIGSTASFTRNAVRGA